MQQPVSLYRVFAGETTRMVEARSGHGVLEAGAEGLYHRKVGVGVPDFASELDSASDLLREFMEDAAHSVLTLVHEPGVDVGRTEAYPAGQWPALGVRAEMGTGAGGCMS